MTQVTIGSYSELDTYRQCQFKHQLGYVERWRSPTTGPALVRGTLWHSVLEVHYNHLRVAQRAQQAARKEGERIDLPIDADAIVAEMRPLLAAVPDEADLVEWMYAGHLEHWGFEQESGWKILAVEYKDEVPLVAPSGKRSRYKLKVKIDLIVRDPEGRIWIVDHKSGKDLPSGKMLDIDDQFGLYTWALRSKGHDVFGSIHNAARTQRNKSFQPLDERFRRSPLYREDRELQVIARDAYIALRQSRQRRPDGGDAPRSPNPDTCRWRCDFTEACLLGRKGMSTQAILRSTGYVQDHTRH